MYCFTRKEDEVLETIGCLGLKPGTVFCKADMERGCYIPGENIRFLLIGNMNAYELEIIEIILSFLNSPCRWLGICEVIKDTLERVGSRVQGVRKKTLSFNYSQDNLCIALYHSEWNT